jgi:hypothetical protein
MNQKIVRKIVFSILLGFILISGCLSGQESEKGTLHVTSSPSSAEIYLDNQFQGSTPATVPSVEQGNHTLEFRYSGYQSWSTDISVSPGNSYYYAALLPQYDNLGSAEKTPLATIVPSKVTVQASKNTMIIGESILFSGTSIGSDSVILTLYGPGYYSKGILLDQPKANSVGSWSYTWNPGYSIQSGSYTLVVEDFQKTTSSSVKFSVVGGGEVSIAANSYAASRGETITFSGRCTTGAQNVLLVLYGPERFSGGIELGSLSVSADKTWNFMYTLDNSMPTGSYTMYVYDIPKTSSSTTQFTVGFTS